METRTIIFIGPQGSGKGTQIEKLKTVLEKKDSSNRVVDIQTGRRFRALAQKKEGYTENHVGETLDSGTLQPLFLSVVLWGDAMREKLDTKSHLIIDGFPRIVAEATVLESALDFYQRKELTIINLDTPEEVVRKRMEERAREDDTPDSIEERLTWYREETLPVIGYYRNRLDTAVIDVNGAGTIDEVHEEILKQLKII